VPHWDARFLRPGLQLDQRVLGGIVPFRGLMPQRIRAAHHRWWSNSHPTCGGAGQIALKHSDDEEGMGLWCGHGACLEDLHRHGARVTRRMSDEHTATNYANRGSILRRQRSTARSKLLLWQQRCACSCGKTLYYLCIYYALASHKSSPINNSTRSNRC